MDGIPRSILRWRVLCSIFRLFFPILSNVLFLRPYSYKNPRQRVQSLIIFTPTIYNKSPVSSRPLKNKRGVSPTASQTPAATATTISWWHVTSESPIEELDDSRMVDLILLVNNNDHGQEFIAHPMRQKFEPQPKYLGLPRLCHRNVSIRELSSPHGIRCMVRDVDGWIKIRYGASRPLDLTGITWVRP